MPAATPLFPPRVVNVVVPSLCCISQFLAIPRVEATTIAARVTGQIFPFCMDISFKFLDGRTGNRSEGWESSDAPTPDSTRTSQGRGRNRSGGPGPRSILQTERAISAKWRFVPAGEGRSSEEPTPERGLDRRRQVYAGRHSTDVRIRNSAAPRERA